MQEDLGFVNTPELKRWLHDRVDEIDNLPAFRDQMEKWYIACDEDEYIVDLGV